MRTTIDRRPAAATAAAEPEPGGSWTVRLARCPYCSGRARRIELVDGQLSGTCIGCGTSLSRPVATERVTIVRVM